MSDGPKVTYPIVQIYFNSELKTEFFCDDDIALFVKKVSSYLNQLDYDVSSNGNVKASGSVYVYSDDQLKQEMASHDAVVFKVFRQSCVKCVQFDEHYYDLVNAEQLSKYRWIQADASNIPAFVGALKLRLLGNVVSDDDSNLENCIVCNNSGFTICSSCDGKGLVSRGPNTVFCPTCVGYKKVRCQNCGGKCIRCAL